MEFPFGHHHRRSEEEEERYPPPHQHHHQHHGGPPQPQPQAAGYSYSGPPHHEVNNPYPAVLPHSQPSSNYYPTQTQTQYPPPPPPFHVQHVSRDYHNPHFPPPPQPPPVVYPPPPAVEHESHHQHHHNIHLPSFIHRHSHSDNDKPTVRVFCKAETSYSLTIRNGHVILAPSDADDMSQHWIKDEKYSTKVKDEEGFPSFALVNKATGQAIKHAFGNTRPVQLIRHNPDKFDESILWTESNDLGDGYRTIRMINNIRLNLDALNGDKNHGGVHDGTIAVLWDWKKGDNQRWKIVCYCKSFNNSN